ncbi:putative amine oxidase [copper-containing] [Mizuhopecten yessoensis]|uniref:putative amine oxidase [copper-containing] n=1 Tax=Mizuhopecten yessoensis TaxID=6573 RepID=UPI000B45EEDC|nr:putative amine oxidase [copper-containing] [Mizuhopecten yessoensis]
MLEADAERGQTLAKSTFRNMKEMLDNSFKWKWISLIFTISTTAFLVISVSVWVVKDRQIEAAKLPSCTHDSDRPLVRAKRQSASESDVFAALTAEEIDEVLDYLYTDTNLNLTKPEEAAMDSSFIHTIELQPPRKQSVLDYLSGLTGPPKRMAKVLMFRGDASPPVLQEYIVGPMSNISEARVMNTTARQTTIPYNFRPFSSFEFKAIYKHIIRYVAMRAGHVLRESYNATPFDCGNQCLRFSMTPISSAFLSNGERKSWFWFAYDLEFFTLHPLDFQYRVNMTSAHPEEWTIENVWYAKQMFPSLDDFLTKYTCGSINKTVMTFPTAEENRYSSLEFREPLFPEENLRPPIQVEPDGTRITIAGNKIHYLAWDLKYRMSPTVGLQLFDVNFDGERIMYEVSLQEVVVTYSGFSPSARMLNYADSAGLFGTRCRGLLPSVDCPANARFINTHLYSANEGGHRTYENAMCVFEHTTNTPVRRHRAYGRIGAFYAGLVSSVLVVRTILSVINYDYVYDFYFYQTGAVEVKISLTGYLGTTFHTSEESPYGVHIKEGINAGIHNHLFHLKVDLDVKGTENRFETLDIKVENKTDPWVDGGYHMQTYYERNVKETELEARCNYNISAPKYLLVSSNNETSAQGLPRSYRLLPRGMSNLLVNPDYGFSSSIPWARQQVAVTRHKDDEETSTSIFAMWDASDPVVDFAKYIEDDENIVGEDVVAWVTLGTQHIPQTENVPNTGTVGTHLSLFIMPYNYFDEDPSMRSRDGVRVTPISNERPTEGAYVERYNRKVDEACVASVSLPDDDLKQNSRFLFT